MSRNERDDGMPEQRPVQRTMMFNGLAYGSVMNSYKMNLNDEL